MLGSLADLTRAAMPSRLERGGAVRSGALVEPERAGFLGQLVERCSLRGVSASSEVEDVLEPYAAMPVGLIEWDGAVLEELHERWPAHAKKVRRLLRGEEQVLGCDEHGFALLHHFDGSAEHAIHLRGQRDLLAVEADEEPRLGAALNEARQIDQRVEVVRWEDEVVLLALIGLQVRLTGGLRHHLMLLGKSKETKDSSPDQNFRISVPIEKVLFYGRCMSLAEVVDDLITLQQLAHHEDDPDRRRSLDAVRDRLAARDHGVKVSEAARVLGFSQPTIRSWIEAGVLDPVPGVTPVRVDVGSLAAVKHAVDLLREHADDRRLLADVMRLLRDRAALEGEGVRQGFDDLTAGRVVPLTDDLLEEIAATKGKKRSRSKSS